MRRIFTLVLTTVVFAAAVAPVAAGPSAPLVEGPDVPATTPPDAVVRVFDGERYDGCAGKVAATTTMSVPNGTWDRIIAVVTIVPDGDPWDRLFSLSIGDVEVLRGTTPRTAFTVRRDVGSYASLLPSGGVATVTLSVGTYVGEQVGTVDFEFYADEPTGALIAEPFDRVVGVFNGDALTGSLTRITEQTTFSDEAPSSALVELTLSNHAEEEAQFRGRTFRVYVDGKEIAFANAMPYVYAIVGFGGANANTACSGKGTSSLGDTAHPVMWWTGQRALDAAGVHVGVGEIPPYRARVDAADLALLSGARTVEVGQFGGGAVWITSLSFLLDE